VAGKRGRKPFKATVARKRQVEELVSCGMSQDDIARALGCTTPTLVKHFGEQLKAGAAKKRAHVIAQLYKAAGKGNVAAMKKLHELHTVAQALDPLGDQDKAGAAAKVNNGKLGKKQLAQIAATQVGGEGSEWGSDLDPDPPPPGSLPN